MCRRTSWHQHTCINSISTYLTVHCQCSLCKHTYSQLWRPDDMVRCLFSLRNNAFWHREMDRTAASVITAKIHPPSALQTHDKSLVAPAECQAFESNPDRWVLSAMTCIRR